MTVDDPLRDRPTALILHGPYAATAATAAHEIAAGLASSGIRSRTRRLGCPGGALDVVDLLVVGGDDATPTVLRGSLGEEDVRGVMVAAFDVRRPRQGRSQRPPCARIERVLVDHGAVRLAQSRSFFTSRDGTLSESQLADARWWGRHLAEQLTGHPALV